MLQPTPLLHLPNLRKSSWPFRPQLLSLVRAQRLRLWSTTVTSATLGIVGLAAPPLPDPLPLVGLWVGWRLAPYLPSCGEFG